ncbi:MAG: UvrD-helicase domain-containing protein [Bacteroidales bacterium]|nr:UvrD-helicase domain-containing protein [Bacteroidales bacterium]
MIDVKKASAGSGKTYTLAHTYIDLLADELAYRHILAVTFTNKATAEMKDRILNYLAEDPEKRSKLVRILHDYSAFAVSTIDRFFQRALKSFAREIGQMADYQVELDRDSLIAEAMDRILDSLTGEESQKEILGWLRENVADKLESGGRPSIDNTLYEMGKKLGSEERRRLRAAHGVTDDEFSKERLAKVRKSCREIIRKFASDVREAALALPVLDDKTAEGHRQQYTKVVWFKQITKPLKKLSAAAEGTPFMALFEKPFVVYNTARIVEAQVFSLGLAREFFREFEALMHEKNVLPLDDSNTLLARIIAGSDTPFVYEKLGVRYENFLLDEFQDTSVIQWENFLPLLRESDSNHKRSLIVGDVKQSIYRWRDSDWTLLAERVQAEFPGAVVEPRRENYRSCREIVEFNSEFFPYAANTLGLQDLYSDAKQEVKTGDGQQGHVQVSFCAAEDEIPKVMESIETARAAGARFSDIAILVRNNKDGFEIASKLLAGGYPVVSDDSLKVNASGTVRKLVSLLSCLENPLDTINAFIIRDAKVQFPQEYHSLVGLCEDLLAQLREADPDVFEGETLFIEAFMDELREWTEVNGNSLRFFLEYWNRKPRYISSPENSDSITILTVHKAKGLEFPYVIFPFAEKVEIFRKEDRWCWLDVSGTPFDPAVSGIYSVTMSSVCEDSLFAREYELEKRMQCVDNLNIFYVALTRAVCCLHVIACNPPKTHKKGEAKAISHILWDFCDSNQEFSRGSMYDFSALRRESGKSEMSFPAGYPIIPAGGRLTPSTDAFDFFGPDGEVGIDASPRRNGVVLHGIMAGIRSAGDLEGAVREAVLSGTLDSAQAKDALALLSKRITAHPEFFGGGGYNEVSIIAPDGRDRRPDRVIESGGKVTVIDYKFARPCSEHRRQVREYMDLYRSMGYREVEGFLWYVFPDRIEAVD